MMSCWIKLCTPGLLKSLNKLKIYWDTDFRSTSSKESKIFLYAVKHRDADRKFKASTGGPTGWLGKFKTRHGIRNLSIQGEKLSGLSAAEETVEQFLQRLHKVI